MKKISDYKYKIIENVNMKEIKKDKEYAPKIWRCLKIAGSILYFKTRAINSIKQIRIRLFSHDLKNYQTVALNSHGLQFRSSFKYFYLIKETISKSAKESEYEAIF